MIIEKNRYESDLREWELRHPGQVHYRLEAEGARVHATATCSRMTNPPEIPAGLVLEMFADAQDTGLATRGVQWCDTCAVRRVS